MFLRQGEQCPVVIISYMDYSPPNCTCNGNQTNSSKYTILLECLHDMDVNATHPFPFLEPSLTPSRMPKPNVRKTLFSQNKIFLFSKTYYQVSVKSIGQPSEANFLDNSSKQFVTPQIPGVFLFLGDLQQNI